MTRRYYIRNGNVSNVIYSKYKEYFWFNSSVLSFAFPFNGLNFVLHESVYYYPQDLLDSLIKDTILGDRSIREQTNSNLLYGYEF
tara:strand:- start:2220 stop:2474 length:255 start_codon:yes stop_codon:yes gene_type:complete